MIFTNFAAYFSHLTHFIMKKHHMRTLPLLFLAITAAISSCGNSARNNFNKDEGMIWNTTYHITYDGPSTLRDSILNVLDKIGKSLSVFDKSSLVSRVNDADSLEIDSHFKTVYMVSQRICRASGGMFDPTLSPLITAWGFGPGHKISADTAAVDSIMNFTGLHKTRLRGDSIIKDDRRVQFNFSAVAKGYACDAVADMLRRNGAGNYLVEIGGEIAMAGKNPRGGLWKVSVDAPIETDSTEIHDACAVIESTGSGVATSGNYRNYHKDGEKTLGHTISPATGRPVTTDVISATVIAPTCVEADAAATACMAAGSQAAKRMLSELGYEGMLIMPDSVWTSPDFPKTK